MNNTLAAILALGAVAFSGCEEDTKAEKKAWNTPVDIVVISENECEDVCGGRICYENLALRTVEKQIQDTDRYTIAGEGFGSFDKVGESFIFADECVFYKKSAKKELVLERLR